MREKSQFYALMKVVHNLPLLHPDIVPSSNVPPPAPPPSIDKVVSWMQNFDTRMSGVESIQLIHIPSSIK